MSPIIFLGLMQNEASRRQEASSEETSTFQMLPLEFDVT